VSVVLARAGMPGQGRLFAAEGEVVMRRGWKTGYAVLLSVLLGLGGVGCTTQSSVSSPTTPVVVTSSTSSATVSPSSATATATNDDEAAIAAAKTYYSAFSAAFGSLDTTDLRSSFQSCKVCADDADLIDQAKASGRTFTNTNFVISGLSVLSRPDATHVMVRGTLQSPPLVVKDAQGRVVHQSSGAVGTKDFILVKTSGQWRVQGIA